MKITTLLIAASILISCNNATQKKASNDNLFINVDGDGEAKLSRIDLFCQRIEKQYKKDGINDLAFEKANEDFKKQGESFIIDSLGLSGMLTTVASVKKGKGKDFIVHLENVPSYNRKGNFPTIHIDVFVITDSVVANTLKQSDNDVYYLETYTKALPLPYEAVKAVSKDILYTDHASIAKDFSDWNYNFGNWIVESHTIKEYKPEL